MTGPYTTLTVESYNHMENTIHYLRVVIQKARESLEKGAVAETLQILKAADK